jgi:hypothetical protein
MSRRLVFASPVRYHDLRQRHQAFADLLAFSGRSLLFVEPLTSPGFGLAVRKQNRNLHLVTLSLPFRAARFPRCQRLVLHLAFALLRRQFPEFIRNAGLWLADPSFSAWAGWLPKPIIYDRCDRHGHFPGQPLRAWQEYESFLYEAATVILISAPALEEDIPCRARSKVKLVPNAVGKDWLRSLIPAKPPVPPLHLVSSGAHYDWVDFPWLEHLLSEPRLELHIAGAGRGKAFSRLLARPRVTFHGHLRHDGLLSLFDRCHVGVIPFLDLPLIEGVDPIKAYEYRARGLQTWAPELPTLSRHPMVERTFSTATPLSSLVDRFSPPPPGPPPRIPTWNDRFSLVLQLLEDFSR